MLCYITEFQQKCPDVINPVGSQINFSVSGQLAVALGDLKGQHVSDSYLEFVF